MRAVVGVSQSDELVAGLVVSVGGSFGGDVVEERDGCRRCRGRRVGQECRGQLV